MTTSLQGLKIPRGYRGDWPVFEYSLIDYVEANTGELENAREGDASLLANLNTKYASKSYVQLAILNPTPGDIIVTDLAVSALDSGKVGYSLQVNSAGTGLLFANTYTLGLGTFANPALNFNNGANAGLYCISSGTEETLKVKLNNVLAYEIIQNKISGVTLVNMGGIQFDSNGDIFAEDLSVNSIIADADISALSIRTTGTGTLNKSIIAELEVGKGSFTGTGVNATSISEAVVNEATITTFTAGAITTLSGVNLNNYKTVTKDYYADATCTNLPSTGAGGGHLRTTFKTSSNAIQFFIGLLNSGMATRHWNGTSWSTWQLGTGGTGATGPAGPTGPTGATGPAGPAGSGNSNFGIIPIFESSTVGAITYSLPAGDTFLVLIMAGGGGGGLGVGSNGNDGADTVFTIDNDPGYVIATAKKGVGGRNTANMPNSALSYFSKYEAGIFNYIGQDNTLGVVGLTVEAIQCSQPGSYISDPATRSYNKAPVFRLAALSGYDASGGHAIGIAEKGSAGGWCLLKLTKAAGTGSLTLNFDIGSYGVGGTIGTNDGSPGRVIIWST